MLLRAACGHRAMVTLLALLQVKEMAEDMEEIMGRDFLKKKRPDGAVVETKKGR